VWPPPAPLEQVHVCPVLRAPELDAGLLVGSQIPPRERKKEKKRLKKASFTWRRLQILQGRYCREKERRERKNHHLFCKQPLSCFPQAGLGAGRRSSLRAHPSEPGSRTYLTPAGNTFSSADL